MIDETIDMREILYEFSNSGFKCPKGIQEIAQLEDYHPNETKNDTGQRNKMSCSLPYTQLLTEVQGLRFKYLLCKKSGAYKVKLLFC